MKLSALNLSQGRRGAPIVEASEDIADWSTKLSLNPAECRATRDRVGRVLLHPRRQALAGAVAPASALALPRAVSGGAWLKSTTGRTSMLP